MKNKQPDVHPRKCDCPMCSDEEEGASVGVVVRIIEGVFLFCLIIWFLKELVK